MLKPNKPSKPKEPTLPKEFIEIKTEISIDEAVYSIKDLLDKCPENIDSLMFEGWYYSGNDQGEDYGYGLTPYYVTIKENSQYNSQKKKYDKDLKKYILELENYNLNQALYESELEKYNAWLNSEETLKLKEALNKAEANVLKLKKKLKIK